MVKSFKKAMVAGAIVAVGAFAVPAMASAEEWTVDGNPIVGSASATADGSLTIVPVGSAFRITCSASLDVTLGEDAAVQVNDAEFSGCTTNISGCSLSLIPTGYSPYASTLPWLGVGYDASGDQRVALDDVSFVRQFSGCPAPLSNTYFQDRGDLVPVFDDLNQQLRFDGTGGTGTLTSAIGTANLDGNLDIDAGGTLELSS